MAFGSPTVQNRSGEILGSAFQNAIAAYLGAKQQKRQQDIQDEERAQGKSLFEYSHPGFHFTDPNEVLPVQEKRTTMPSVQRTPTGDAGTDSAFQRFLGPTLAAMPMPDRYKYGKGYMLDRSEEDADLQRKSAVAGASEFQKALYTAMGSAQGNPAQTNYNNARTAKLNYDMAHPKPLPPDPRDVHAANRTFDVSHPLPTPPQSQFVFPTGTDPEGKPVVLRGNTKTGSIEPTNIGRPATGQAGQREGAQLAVAQNQAAQADKIMSAFEDELLSGKRNISTAGAAAAKIALSGGAIMSTTAESGLNKLDPALAGYIRAAKALAAAERLITPRGGSNALTHIEGMLAGAGPHANADLINQAREYRKALVGGLNSHGGASPTAKHGTDVKSKYGITPSVP